MQQSRSGWTDAEASKWARDLYENAVDRKDAAGFAAVFTEDATLRFGNNETLRGPAAIEAAIAGFFTAMKALRHETKKLTVHDNMLFLEAFVTYDRHDGKQVTVPAMTVYEMADNASGRKAKECRIYVDLGPLFAP